MNPFVFSLLNVHEQGKRQNFLPVKYCIKAGEVKIIKNICILRLNVHIISAPINYVKLVYRVDIVFTLFILIYKV